MKKVVICFIVGFGMFGVYVGAYFMYLRMAGFKVNEKDVVIDCMRGMQITNHEISRLLEGRDRGAVYKYDYMKLFKIPLALHKMILRKECESDDMSSGAMVAYLTISDKYNGYRYARILRMPTVNGFASVYYFSKFEDYCIGDSLIVTELANGEYNVELNIGNSVNLLYNRYKVK